MNHPILHPPIRTVADARRLLRYLPDNGLDMHPEDNPAEALIDPVTGPLLLPEDMAALETRLNECFSFTPDKWGAFGDVCGYCLAIADAHSGSTIASDYETAALWSSTYETEDRDDNPMDDGEHELAPETSAIMEADCADFLAYVKAAGIDTSEWSDAQMGHDFWLTRNGHGAGFWDRDLPHGDALTEAAKHFGQADLYIGDDGLIYQS